MDDTVFFDTILPTQGLRCIALPKANGKWHHIWGPDNAWLANTTKRIDTSRNVNVYYACSSYLPGPHDVVTGRNHRKQIYVAAVRSFFVDLDVGASEPNKAPKYPTQKAAATAILAFAVRHNLPRPWLVNSGWGVHAYWPMTADMTVEQWKPIAQALKRALTAEGVLYDPSRTADEASVLRPPGTHNRKRQPKLVKVVAVGDVTDFAVFAPLLASFVQAAPADPFAHMGPAPVGIGGAVNSGLTAGAGYDPSSALMIADQCGVIGLMRDTRGLVDQPTWYNSLGVLLHTTEAPAICHEWSKGDPRYTAAETDAKLTQLGNHGPTTCAKLDEFQHAICAACPHWGKITSPIVLGRPRIEKATVETVERVVDKKGFVSAKIVQRDMPYGYGETVQDGKRVLTYERKVKDKDGVVTGSETDVICGTHFYGTTRLWDDDGAVFEFERISREGPVQFTVKGSTIGSGGRELSAELGRNEIVARQGKGQQVHNYMTHWMEQLTKTADQVRAHRSFGWAADGDFVLGDTIIKPDGSESRSLLMGTAKEKRDIVARKGSRETWVQLVDRAYNAPGQEAFQFQIGCAFAAPLFSLMQQVAGVTVYAHTEGSGVGKTTVQEIGLSVWGRSKDMILAQDKVTPNSLWGLLGTYRSLPVVYDELTNAPNNTVSELVFSVSSGRAKERMNSSGELRTNNSNWSTILMASGNTLLSEKLAQHRANSEAEISRLFEFTLEVTPHLSVVEAIPLFAQFAENYGHAGYAFARTISKNREMVRRALLKTQRGLIKEFGLTQVERHWSALFAAVIVALLICRDLKLVAFEIEPIKAWMRTKLEENRGQRTEMVTDYESLIGQMIDELWADVLVTQGVGDLRKNIPVHIEKEPRSKGNVVGRSVRATGNDVASLEISRAAIQTWCAKKMVSPRIMLETAIKAGMCHPDFVRVGLGRGVKGYQTTNNTWCWRFIPDAMDNVVALHQTLSLVQGGKP